MPVGMIGVSVWDYYSKGQFSHVNFERIQIGMSREKVVELLGSPGEETTSIPSRPASFQESGATGKGDSFLRWNDVSRDIYVGFIDGSVSSKFYYVVEF